MVERSMQRKVVVRWTTPWIVLPFVAVLGKEYVPQEECGLYLAPSAIPGAGLGMYAGHKAYEKNEPVGDGDLMIPTWDLDYHNGKDPYSHLWDEYTWSPTMFDGMYDDVENIDASSIISSGFGAAINCMLPLVNVHDDLDGYDLTTSGVPSDSPGAGAFTPMTGRTFVALEPIEPFSELYASYGEQYFEGRKVYDFVPFDRHYKMADAFVNGFVSNVTMWKETDDVWSDGLEGDLWGFIVQLREIWDKTKTLFALPGNNSTTIDDLKDMMAVGGTSRQNYNSTVKTKEWMDEHGQCMDNIRSGISTNPLAGQGAFATRFIPEGGLVSPAPLVHLPNKTSLTIYDHKITSDGKWVRNVESPIHHQLLLNYCFGHRDSTLLLCPYGHHNFLINHDHVNPNAKVVWTDTKRLRHPEWLEQPVSKWGHEFHSGLSLDFVALRDIAPGEEITIDYGIEWETAWQEHVRNFDRPRRSYTPAFELNRVIDLTIPTVFEPDSFEGVITFCRSYYFPPNYNIDPYKFNTEEDHTDWVEDHYTCRVLSRQSHRYTVEVFERQRWLEPMDIYERHLDTPVYILFDLPRDAIYFRDAVYQRDHHQFWAFRHELMLPDDLFPEIWKNKNVV